MNTPNEDNDKINEVIKAIEPLLPALAKAENAHARREKLEALLREKFGDGWEAMLGGTHYGTLPGALEPLLLEELDRAGKLVSPLDYHDMEQRAERLSKAGQ